MSACVLHTCALTGYSAVVCFGGNEDNQSTAPAGTFISINAGEHHSCAIKGDHELSGLYHSCAIKTDNSLLCWGQEDYGKTTPPAGSFVEVIAGKDHTCAVHADGRIQCWGLIAR